MNKCRHTKWPNLGGGGGGLAGEKSRESVKKD